MRTLLRSRTSAFPSTTTSLRIRCVLWPSAKNFLFVGDPEAGENLAALYSLVSTCEAHGANPYTYLADVLMRVQNHPASRVAELRPDRWLQLRAH